MRDPGDEPRGFEFGKVEIPQEAFINALKMDDN